MAIMARRRAYALAFATEVTKFRALYDIDHGARMVRIMAIGEKQRERLFIGGEEVRL
jgi:hypothetical protein